jgi:hypothetical protein
MGLHHHVVSVGDHLAGEPVTRQNAAWTRRRAWHVDAVRQARTPLRRLAAAFDWLRAEARLAGPDTVERVTQALLAHAGQLHEASKPAPRTEKGATTS